METTNCICCCTCANGVAHCESCFYTDLCPQDGTQVVYRNESGGSMVLGAPPADLHSLIPWG